MTCHTDSTVVVLIWQTVWNALNTTVICSRTQSTWHRCHEVSDIIDVNCSDVLFVSPVCRQFPFTWPTSSASASRRIIHRRAAATLIICAYEVAVRWRHSLPGTILQVLTKARLICQHTVSSIIDNRPMTRLLTRAALFFSLAPTATIRATSTLPHPPPLKTAVVTRSHVSLIKRRPRSNSQSTLAQRCSDSSTRSMRPGCDPAWIPVAYVDSERLKNNVSCFADTMATWRGTSASNMRTQ